MDTAPFTVPTVDISPYVNNGSPEERAAVAAEIDAACGSVGFMQIVGHGIPAEVIDGLTEAIDGFFGLSLDQKKLYMLPPAQNRGYTPPKSESLSYSIGVDPVTRMNDFFEAFNIGTGADEYPGLNLSADEYAPTLWPVDPATFQRSVSAYFAAARTVARTLTRIFADALHVDVDYFESLTDHSLDVMRMNNYALPPGEIELGAELTGMGEHTDFGIVTVLWADQVEGLQVLDRDGQWHDVSPADEALLVNLGDVAARLTNDHWMSTLHRVKPPIVNGTIRRRRSAAFFHDGNADATVQPLLSLLEPGEVPLYEPVTIHEHIIGKIQGARAGKKNHAAKRDAARVNAASQ